MSYKNLSIIKDVNNKPVPQYWNETTQQYEVITSEEGRLRVNMVDKEGREIQTQDLVNQINNEIGELTDSLNAMDYVVDLANDLDAHKEDYTTQRQQDQLKVAKVEKDINDYKSTMASVNVNQEAKQDVSGYGVVSLPKNSANGQVSVSVKGQSINQIIKNGDFSNDGTDWTIAGGVSFDSANKRFDFDVSQSVSLYQLNKFVPGKYALLFNQTLKSGTTGHLMSLFRNGTTNLEAFSYSNKNGYICSIIDLTSEADRFLFIRGSAGDGIFSVDDIMLIRISGTEYENLTTDEIKKRIPSYISAGTKSTISASRLKSVGKNLFDGRFTLGTFGASDLEVPATNAIRTGYIKLTESKKYVRSHADGYAVSGWRFYDKNKLYIGRNTHVFDNIPPNYAYVRFVFSVRPIRDIVESDYENIKFMLEEGTQATPYEPYTESLAYLPNVGELRSLPNGTYDEISFNQSTGMYECKKKTGEVVLNGGENWGISDYNGVQAIYIPSISLPNMAGWATAAKEGKIRVFLNNQELPEANSGSRNPENIGKFYTTETPTLGLIFGLGTFATSQEAKNYFNSNPITLTYQLAEPIITPIEVSGTLLSNPSGTVYVENVVADAGIYTTKFDIKELQLPIKSIDKLIKYNFETGVQTVLDTSLAVINEDKKSFTHPNLTDKDMVFVDYYYDVEGTLGETTIEYLDSRHTIKDSVNNKFYSWSIKSENGVPTVELTEVL